MAGGQKLVRNIHHEGLNNPLTSSKGPFTNYVTQLRWVVSKSVAIESFTNVVDE